VGGTSYPLTQFVLKVHSRCDLACDHCYVYVGPDQSWHGRPAAIPAAVTRQAAYRIAEHARAHQLPAVQVILHGGEPLLARLPRLRRVIGDLQSALAGTCELDLRIHTNGVLLDEPTCELFAEHGVKVGVSLDGYEAANDRHRRYADGRSSYEKVISAIGLLRTGRFRPLYAGLLCTIDTANDPIQVYDSLAALDPPRIDFLLPHATWEHPPARQPTADAEYADWLIAIFGRWSADDCPMEIRTFDSVISTLRGRRSLTEALGLEPASLAVIETDGSYEQVDSLKTAYAGAPGTGFDVFRHSIDQVTEHPGIRARQQGIAGLSAMCQKCPVVTSCGGGLYAHRYRAKNGFDNPSVYCPDLFKMISHIGDRLPAVKENTPARDFPTHAVRRASFRALAAGFGDAADMAQLAGAQRDLSRQLLAAVFHAATAASRLLPAALIADMRAAWIVLTNIDRDQPQALDAVLAHPYLRAWAMRCLGQFRDPRSRAVAGSQDRPTCPLAADLSHLGAVALAAAIRAGHDAAVALPLADGTVAVPGLGRLKVAGEDPQAPGRDLPRRAFIELVGNTVTIAAGTSRWELTRTGVLGRRPQSWPATGARAAAEWQPVRMLTAPGLAVALEDTDPYRDCHQWPAAPRLTAGEHERWQRRVLGAWRQIRRDHSEYAPAIAAGLSVIMPLQPSPEGRDVSATARDAFGAVGLALPTGSAALALLLMHEFQHVKLGAILDVYDLCDPADRRLFHAPWRTDQRPLEGLLQGAYAHLAVTDYWRRRQATTSGAEAREASQRFAHWQAHTRDAIDTLATSGSLTPLGELFVSQMRSSVEP
jgi:uncharacterized protein